MEPDNEIIPDDDEEAVIAVMEEEAAVESEEAVPDVTLVTAKEAVPYDVATAIEDIERLSSGDIPYFYYFPDDNRIGACVSEERNTALFASIISYMEELSMGGDPNAVYVDTLKRIWSNIHCASFFRLIGDYSTEDDYNQRLLDVRQKCARISSGRRCFIMLLDVTGFIHSYMGGCDAPYNPSFNLFDRICKCTLAGRKTDTNKLKMFKASDNMKGVIDAWESTGKISAPKAYDLMRQGV